MFARNLNYQQQMYFPSSQFNNQHLAPPPLPESKPLSLTSPPLSAPMTNQTKERKQSEEKVTSKVVSKQHSKPPMPTRTSNKAETDEDRRRRKKREYEKQKQKEKEKHRQKKLKESQDKILHKTRKLSLTIKPHGSVSRSRMSGDKTENRLKKPITFLCRLKFRDELPDLTAKPKLMSIRRDKDRAVKCDVISLENVYKPQMFVETDLGIPLDLLDLSVYKAPKDGMLHVAPEDEKLLQEDVSSTPINKDGSKRNERPVWLLKTEYLTSLNEHVPSQCLADTRRKKLREINGLYVFDNINSRKTKIQDIVSSFSACKSRPVHATDKKLQPVEILPLLPDFERSSDQFVVATFDGAPTALSESYNKMDESVRDAHESQAIMKSFVANTSGSTKPDKFLAYMVPSVGEISKDICNENEDISYTWVREYNWDVRGEDADNPSNYLVAFGESEARYMPLPTNLMLRKKRAREGKNSDEIEHFPVPSSVTVRQRAKVSVDMNESESYVGSKKRRSNSRDHGEMGVEDGQPKGMQDDGDMYQSSGAENVSD